MTPTTDSGGRFATWCRTIGIALAMGLISQAACADEAVAGFNGAWKGQGVLIRYGQLAPCSLFSLSFVAGPDGSFILDGGKRVCADLQINSDLAREVMSVKDGMLFGPDGKPAGRYETDFIEVHFVMPGVEGKPSVWRSTMRREGDNMIFEESLSLAGQTTPMLTFAGALRRQ